MLSSRYHLGSLIAVFLALGIGMLIGSLLGERFYSGAENRVLQMMMEKYEQRMLQNEQLQQELTYVQRMSQQTYSSLPNKTFLYISNGLEEDDLERGLRLLGSQVLKVPLAWADEAELSGELGRLLKTTDLVLTKEKQAVQWLRPHTLTMSGEKLGGSLSIPPVVDLTEVTFDDFARVTEVFNYLQQILEGLSDERSGVYRYPGME